MKDEWICLGNARERTLEGVPRNDYCRAVAVPEYSVFARRAFIKYPHIWGVTDGSNPTACLTHNMRNFTFHMCLLAEIHTSSKVCGTL